MEYNPRTPHQGGTKAFKDLTFKEKAQSINGDIANFERAIRYHARFGATRTARLEQEIREKCIRQVERLSQEYRDTLATKAIKDSDAQIETLLRSKQKRKFDKELARNHETH
jgi:hypothetical protein